MEWLFSTADINKYVAIILHNIILTVYVMCMQMIFYNDVSTNFFVKILINSILHSTPGMFTILSTNIITLILRQNDLLCIVSHL